jgi:lipid II:glycine glycyltransferase (peptidoglycan interpeptide bridge formation enzyme)
MMARKKFEGASDVAGFARIQPSLPDNQQMKVLICEQGGIPVAGLVGTGLGDMGIYLLGATNDVGMKSKGAYLLQWRMIQWLKENGVRCYNLGGINPEKNPGVYHFKAGLSGSDSRYIKPRVACESIGSLALARAVGTVRGKVRGVLDGIFRRS